MTNLKTTIAPSIASWTAGMPWSSPRAAAPSRPPPSRYGFTLGERVVLRSLRIVLGLALLVVAGLLMAAHLALGWRR
jgi:hypothetical protein